MDRSQPAIHPLKISPSQRAIKIIQHTCCVAGSFNFLAEIRSELRKNGIDAAVRHHDTAALFDWMISAFSFQGISDRVAREYIRKHGNVTLAEIESSFAKLPTCPRLKSYWTYDQCGYDKGSGCCREPEHVGRCPVPTYKLRNGRLNQTANSLFLFFRDIARGDVVGWIDTQLAGAVSTPGDPQNISNAQEALIGPLRNVFGVSDKLLTMTLATLLIGAERSRPQWLPIGIGMIAVDTLVHNFLFRTGILREHDAEHAYGLRCYKSGGCADIIRSIAQEIDARQFNNEFPANFPRFVQHAVWRYSALDGLNICNGNNIDDRLPCSNNSCQLYRICDRKCLEKHKKE